MKNQINEYREVVDRAIADIRMNAYDDKNIFSSDCSDVYRLVQHYGKPINFLHKSHGNQWIIGDGDMRFRLGFFNGHRTILRINK